MPLNSAWSRYHFLLEVNPPLARVRDVGSLNGTYVNGVKHGGREKGQAPEDVPDDYFAQVDLRNGDRIQVGTHQMAVQIEYGTTVREPLDATEREQVPPDNDEDEDETVLDGSESVLEQLLHHLGAKRVEEVPQLAATFYVMLTGRYPRPQKPGQDPIQAILKNNVIPIRQRDASIPQPIADVIDRALLTDKRARYQTAGFMLDALEKVW